MAAWRRVEPIGPRTVVAGFFVIVGLGFTGFITYMLVAGGGHWEVDPVVGSLAIYGFMTVWTAFAWRMVRTGVYVSDDAVRVMYVWGNRIVPWTDIAEITQGRAMLGSLPTVRDAIFLKLADGTLMETPLQRRAELFAGGLRKNSGPVLDETDFAATLTELREKLGQR